MAYFKDKRAAMELSVGTIVVIVLMMTVLVLGIFFVQRIFDVGTTAIKQIETEMTNQVQQLFGSQESRRVVMFPTSQRVTIKQGARDEGFGLFIRNGDQTPSSFTFDVMATDTSACPSSLTEEVATGWLLGESGVTPDIESGGTYQRLITFIIPETAPLCTINYDVVINRNTGKKESYGSLNFALTIK